VDGQSWNHCAVVGWFVNRHSSHSLTSHVVDGVCHTIYENVKSGGLYFTFVFVWHFLFPLVIFIFCYSKILAVVRRQTRITNGKGHTKSDVAGPSGSQNTPGANEHVLVTMKSFKRRAEEGSSAGEECAVQQLSHAEKKIIRTMLTVTIFFVICWFPADFYLVINYWQFEQFPVSRVLLFLTFLAYMDVLLNAVIYSHHLSIFNRCWRAVRELPTATSSIAVSATHGSARISPDTKF
jgi:hypothetical protein